MTMAEAFLRRFNGMRRGAGVVLDLLLPERCPVCGAPLQGGGTALCPDCFSALRFAVAPVCDRCGRPLPASGACACIASGVVRQRRFAVIYGDVSSDLILRFKHGDRPDLAGRLATWMARAGADLLTEADLLVPVPIHWTRLVSRQYNQAAELARRLSVLSGTPWDARALVRVRRTPSQGRFSARARRANVAGAFAVRSVPGLDGRRVLLIDDVVTTGATVEACAKALLAAGAASVSVLSAAAVERGDA